MTLWNELASYKQDRLPYRLTAAAAAILFLICWVGAGWSDHPGTFGLAAMAILLIAAAALPFLYTRSVNKVFAWRSSVLAECLKTEHHLLLLGPIDYNDNGRGQKVFEAAPNNGLFDATANAVDRSGEIVRVGFHWLRLGSHPQQREAQLPEGFNPIHMTRLPASANS